MKTDAIKGNDTNTALKTMDRARDASSKAFVVFAVNKVIKAATQDGK